MAAAVGMVAASPSAETAAAGTAAGTAAVETAAVETAAVETAAVAEAGKARVTEAGKAATTAAGGWGECVRRCTRSVHARNKHGRAERVRMRGAEERGGFEPLRRIYGPRSGDVRLTSRLQGELHIAGKSAPSSSR
jgi:hypothetical protein